MLYTLLFELSYNSKSLSSLCAPPAALNLLHM